MIKLQIVGHLGKDAIVKEVNGKNVINYSVAHSEKYKDAQGVQKEKTTWVECAYWSDKTAVAPYLTKGTLVYSEGTPEVEAYTNRDGQNSATLRMRVLNLQLLGSNKDASGSNMGNVTNQGSAPAPVVKSPMGTSDAPDDDLPF